MSIKVVCWKWKPYDGYRTNFTSEHVNIFASMVKRNFHIDHEIVCITDDASGIDDSIRTIELWDDCKNIPAPYQFPSCYRRLKAFSPEMREVIGDRFVSIDLDTVIVGDVTPLWCRSDDFVIWGKKHRKTNYNGSMWLMTAGSRSRVWETFDEHYSPYILDSQGVIGTDQGWISHVLGAEEKTWGELDGVYAFRDLSCDSLPDNARIVFFPGEPDPWDKRARSIEWIRNNYR